MENGIKKDFLWKEDWGKIIHLYDSSYFIAGGSWQDDREHFMEVPAHMRPHKYSSKAFILDTATGEISR